MPRRDYPTVLQKVGPRGPRGAFPPYTPPTSTLPFAEASLRAGYVTLTTTNIPVGTDSYTLPTSADYLIDLGWVKRDRALTIYTRPGQRVHTKNLYVEVTIAATSSNAYTRRGFGYRPLSGTAAPAEHCSLTGALITGPRMLDGLTYGVSTGYTQNGATKVTYQRCRVESAALYNGAITSDPSTEHSDGFQMQGPLGTIEFGECTFYKGHFASGDPGKCWMLNDYFAAGYTVNATRVNFRDVPGLTGGGADIIQDIRNIVVNFTDVYSLQQGSPNASWTWQTGSSLYLFYGSSLQWTAIGTAPNRTATFPAGSGFNGVVYEGISPTGVDYCTRAMLGL
jgi:hypothetical protein